MTIELKYLLRCIIITNATDKQTNKQTNQTNKHEEVAHAQSKALRKLLQ